MPCSGHVRSPSLSSDVGMRRSALDLRGLGQSVRFPHGKLNLLYTVNIAVGHDQPGLLEGYLGDLARLAQVVSFDLLPYDQRGSDVDHQPQSPFVRVLRRRLLSDAVVDGGETRLVTIV